MRGLLGAWEPSVDRALPDGLTVDNANADRCPAAAPKPRVPGVSSPGSIQEIKKLPRHVWGEIPNGHYKEVIEWRRHSRPASRYQTAGPESQVAFVAQGPGLQVTRRAENGVLLALVCITTPDAME